VLYGAHVRQLNLAESYLPALTAATVHVDGVLRITDCLIPGKVQLGGAKISGALFADRARLDDENSCGKDPVFQLDHATIGGNVRIAGATISGAVNLNDANLSMPGGTVLDADSLTVGTDVSARALRTNGRFNMRGARIPGQLILAHSRLCNPDGVALRASSCAIGEIWLRRATPIEGEVNLRRTQTDLLNVPPEVWPEHVSFDGLNYGSLTPHLPADQRLHILSRDIDGYVPTPTSS
jgi:hypothetical protein